MRHLHHVGSVQIQILRQYPYLFGGSNVAQSSSRKLEKFGPEDGKYSGVFMSLMYCSQLSFADVLKHPCCSPRSGVKG